ncbi:NAD(P)-binding protein [Ceraceosorus guamensis]|uniref:NAD(P)-binding protein n=1 Tax=Ceraceosorus guamensis TaxID=1522189 RepID=A0A316W5U7_9BASI|nr:NAD(P)-binding protein [Ceraceosorus guamensis]PWN44468.1 NAD(P)-binding protein [Ceraceosorus guamensis]
MSHALHRYFHANASGSTGSNGSSSDVKTIGAPYALVTGATGGMGEEWALQLAELGFNIIIQGRNRTKLEAVKAQISKRHAAASSRNAGDAVDVRLLVCEATIYPNAGLTDGLAAVLSDSSIRLTVLINNLGVNVTHFPRLEDTRSEEIAEIVIANSFFPAETARICLPHLKRHQPALLVTVTSLGAWATPPYLAPYIGTKGFDVAFSDSLRNEQISEGTQVDVVCMAPGQVQSGMCNEPVGLMIPTSKDWVTSAIASLRSTWWTPVPAAVIAPWTPHAWGQWFTALAPRCIIGPMSRNIIKDLKAKEVDARKGL